MPAQDNAALVRTAYEAFNDRDLDRAAALAAEELEWLNVAMGETFRGPGGYKQYMQNGSTPSPIRAGAGRGEFK